MSNRYYLYTPYKTLRYLHQPCEPEHILCIRSLFATNFWKHSPVYSMYELPDNRETKASVKSFDRARIATATGLNTN